MYEFIINYYLSNCKMIFGIFIFCNSFIYKFNVYRNWGGFHDSGEILTLIVRSRIEGGVPNKGNLWDILFRAAKTLYLMNLPVDQANSGAKYEFCYVFMVKVRFLKSIFQN